MDPSSELINYMSFVGDACLADCATTYTILRDKKYFSNFTLAQSNVHTISSPVNLIKGFGKATIILLKGTKLQIDTTRKKLINDAINASWKSYNDTFLKCHGIDCHCINWANNDVPNKHHL